MTMGFSTADLASHHMLDLARGRHEDEYHHGLLLVKENLDVNEQAMLQKHNQADLEQWHRWSSRRTSSFTPMSPANQSRCPRGSLRAPPSQTVRSESGTDVQ